MSKPMIQVFDLREDLRANPDRVRLAQALTLNADKTKMGLKGARGLFGSSEWWGNIESGNMPTMQISGVIVRAYYAGQGGSGPNNMIDVLTDEGRRETVGIYVNDPENVRFFQNGHRAEVIYALDELKQQPAFDGSVNYSKVALTMRVSATPVE
ncbi:MAG: hypothetical protein QM759_10545 [Terricaulis sp.]